jgi:lipid II:glycine glycyltransferase (peptidoglycan interpeptide bridge formation enzyme)
MDSKAVFTEWCATRNDIPIFLTPAWLDAVSGAGEWDVAVVGQPNDLLGFMPWFSKRKLGFSIITMPPLTPYLGPWLHYPKGQKQAARLAFEKKVMEALLEQLPASDRFIQYFHPAVTNWLPFRWKGFDQTSRYTYILPALDDLASVYDGLQGNIRREIKKAEQTLTVAPARSVDLLFGMLQEDMNSKKEPLLFDRAYMQRVFHAADATGNARVLHAVDAGGTVVAAILLVWDGMSAYYLAGACHPGFKTSGAMSLLLWEGIRFSATVTGAFNFEGSVREPIERFFRAFGGTLTPYHEIRRTDSKVLRVMESTKKN